MNIFGRVARLLLSSLACYHLLVCLSVCLYDVCLYVCQSVCLCMQVSKHVCSRFVCMLMGRVKL